MGVVIDREKRLMYCAHRYVFIQYSHNRAMIKRTGTFAKPN